MAGSETTARLHRNLAEVRRRIAEAAQKSGHSANAVNLVAVTKTVSAAVAAELHRLGVVDLGESRPQVLWKKAAVLPDTVQWHMIGHIQTNKLRRTVPLVWLAHSIDRMSLAEAYSAESLLIERKAPVTLQVNLTGETSKHGFRPDELRQSLPRLFGLAGIEIVGLMTMARYETDPQACRGTFAELREFRDELARSAGRELPVLSMGMSHDYPVAVEEGATHVRVGSALFEGIEPE